MGRGHGLQLESSRDLLRQRLGIAATPSDQDIMETEWGIQGPRRVLEVT
jgi:hypothetical protein